ncbi:hypothetical protein V5P93_003334 [Actinokineospora auranticolor]|uniref:Secreted protein n=1 Tax=Actinokineospora auranticolor TaxID=155976 RepID=A0A2S6H1V0_9PSEU|nr:hypothetical protein [Actinokineospora auranticolor]PPK71468.1 hypothetical protein CLV40_101658 [Actinokineospora auranticolor]
MRIAAACAVVALSLVGACSSNSDSPPKAPVQASTAASYPAGQEGAEKVVEELRTSADPGVLVKGLAPTGDDFRGLFEADFAAKAQAFYSASSPEVGALAKPEQTEVKLWSATSEDLKANSGDAGQFPGGYAKIAQYLKPGVTLYRWKYVKPGADSGMAYDGLVHTGSRWVWIPKPWRVLEG